MLRGVVVFLFVWLASVAAEARQVALVVGITGYDRVQPLKNPQRDAAAIADSLRDKGFEVLEAFDADRFTLDRVRQRFLAAARSADLALFYFAGHGLQLFDRNVLLARDAEPVSAATIEELGLDLARLMADLRAAGPVRSAFLIDACRDNPLAFDDTVALLRRLEPAAGGAAAAGIGNARSVAPRPTRGLSLVTLPTRAAGAGETLVFFAAQPGQVSYDGDGRHSFFVEGLIEAFAKTDTPLGEILRGAGAYVRTASKGQQVPQLVSDWTSDVVLGQVVAAKVRYLNVSRRDGAGPLTPEQARVVGEGQRAHPILSGTFIVKESQSFTQNYLGASESERQRAEALGSVNGFAIDYDIDRDGRLETIGVYFRQTNVVMEVVDEGVSLLDTPCYDFDKVQIESVEFALRDINGDRRPEIFMHYQSELGSWGTLCVLEYVGAPDLGASRRGTQHTSFADKSLFRTLLRYEGAWTVSVGADNSIETCAGSNCHTRSAWTFDGTHFQLLLDQSDRPQGGRALPFRDQAEHERNVKAVPAATVQPPTSSEPPVASGTATDIQRFVAGVYLPSGTSGGSAAALQYEPSVSYYGKPTARAQVLADKDRYARKWSRRTYALVPGTLTVTADPAHAGVVNVAFDYTFEVADGRRTVAGRGRTQLGLKRIGQGFSIAREEGQVVERR